MHLTSTPTLDFQIVYDKYEYFLCMKCVLCTVYKCVHCVFGACRNHNWILDTLDICDTGGCEALCMSWELRLGLLRVRRMILTSEQSLKLLSTCFEVAFCDLSLSRYSVACRHHGVCSSLLAFHTEQLDQWHHPYSVDHLSPVFDRTWSCEIHVLLTAKMKRETPILTF